jgi:hypothetical protein
VLGPFAQLRVAHAHSTGSAYVHSARGPWLAGLASACAARAGAARERTPERSALSGHTLLEHPRWRGYPPGMGVEAIAHWSALSTGRGKKTGSAVVFSDEARAPVASGGPASGWREREVGSTLHRRKVARGGSGSAHRGRAHDGGGGRTATVVRSDGVSRLRTQTTVRSGRREQWGHGRKGCLDAGVRTGGPGAESSG